MVKLRDDTDFSSAENVGYEERTLKKVKMKANAADDFGSTNKLLSAGRGGGGKSKFKWKKAIRKIPAYVHHDNIYDLDEVDSKFEGIIIFHKLHSLNLHLAYSILLTRNLFG